MLAAAGVSLTGLSVPHFWAVLVLPPPRSRPASCWPMAAGPWSI
ncbi:Uncharacterised protein [Bordetella pertussis]|nr:Uncharacterised protein [Bordetella pertussis]